MKVKMTVGELIKDLSKLPGDAIVYIPSMDSYGYFDTIMCLEVEDGSDGRKPEVSLIPCS